MIDDYPHHYQRRREGGGLFSELAVKTIADVGKKIATNTIEQGAKKVGEFLADKATKVTKGLLVKTLQAASDKDFVNEILSM
jgi:hypothetical protein